MTVIAEGYNAFETPKTATGTIKYLKDPASVMGLIKSGKLGEHILLVRGGTTTFLAPGPHHGRHRRDHDVRGHRSLTLGILSREFQIPCVMTAYLTSSSSRYVVGDPGDAHFAEIVAELEGKNVTLDCSDHDLGKVVLNA